MAGSTRRPRRPAEARPAATGTATDHRKGRRRRGKVLERAILAATMAELEGVGYAGLTMEAVARRARTSKASIYLRWPHRPDLVAAAVEHALAGSGDADDTGSLRGDLLAAVRRQADRLAGPLGEAARGLVAETLTDPERTRAAREAIMGRRDAGIAQVLGRAADRGELPSRTAASWVLRAPSVLVAYEFLANGAPVRDEALVEIVDQVVLPLVTGRCAGGAAG